MAEPPVLAELLERHGRTFAAEADIDLMASHPTALFRLLCLSLLISARIRASVAMTAARALFQAGWITPRRMSAATWEARTDVLNRAGYARYDERTSRYLAAAADQVIDRYGGDLNELRRQARGSTDSLIDGLVGFTGIGPVGASFYVREVQEVWVEFAPYLDDRAARVAQRLGLPTDAPALARLLPSVPFAVLVAALVRADLSHDVERFIERA